MINDFESSKKGFEKDTIDHMSSRELDLGKTLLDWNHAKRIDMAHLVQEKVFSPLITHEVVQMISKIQPCWRLALSWYTSTLPTPTKS